MSNTSPKFPEAIPGEQVFSEYDDETGSYGVFGEESGHCYASYGSKEDAQREARRQNDVLWGTAS